MSEVEAVPTPIAPSEQGRLLVQAWSARLGKPPSRSLAELCLAQLLLENAHGKSLYNYNAGNITGGGTYYLNPHVKASLHFTAYDSPEAGMADYVRVVARAGRLQQAGESGDATAFAQAIRDSNYTPGIDVPSVASSLSGVVQTIRSKGYLPSLTGAPSFPGAPSVSPIRTPVVIAAALGVAFVIWEAYHGT